MDKPLRKGWTTGACAAAAAKAAWSALRQGSFDDSVSIRLPRGETPCFALSRRALGADWATAGVIKDAGDDPDVTHGAEIVATVTRMPAGHGLRFAAGDGVGTVTLPGLPVPVGEAAINPGPRTQIEANLADVAPPGDLLVTIAIPGGAEIARQTMNGRLGILGGLSILGTTGVVLPYSCAAWIQSIRSGVDVARATGIDHLAGCTGKTSETAVVALHGLGPQALIDMGGFVGALLKYLRDNPVARLTLGGGFAKMCKLAAGEMDLHSKAASVDTAWLAERLRELGCDGPRLDAAQNAVSAAAVLALADELPLADLVARRARETALAVLAGGVAVDLVIVDRAGKVLAHAG